MQTIKNITLMMLMFTLAFGFSFSAGAVSSDNTPTVKIKKTKDTYTTLQITSTNLKRKSVKIKVKVNNVDNDKEEVKIFEKTLSKAGKTDIKIEGLAKDNEYSFKVAIKKDSENNYSSYADEVVVNAKGALNYSPTVSIKDEASTSVTLTVTSTKLKKQKVRIKVRVENKDTDKIETRVFSKTLSKNGKADIVVDNLSKNTEYGFKTLIKKTKDKGFSGYSSEESTETEK
jgi:hypothetical protein